MAWRGALRLARCRKRLLAARRTRCGRRPLRRRLGRRRGAFKVAHDQARAQRGQHPNELLDAHLPGPGLDFGHADLTDAEPLPDLGLGEPTLLAQGPQVRSQLVREAEITLMRLDPAGGALTRVGDFAYDGILPEAAAFDGSSRYLAVVTYDHFDDSRTGGSVDFWRIGRDPLDPERVELVKTEHSVSVTRGAHSMLLVR